MAINKVIYGDKVLLDLTSDTVNQASLSAGFTAHDKSGSVITGTNTNDVTSTDATAAVAEILNGKTAYARGAKLTGTMPNNGGVSGTISTKNGSYTIPIGFHDGSGSVSIASTEKAKLIASNIKAGITILGIEGDYGGEGVSAQSDKTATPKTTQQTITPDPGYDYLSQVVVNAIPYNEANNAAGGTTVTIAGV